MNNISNITKRNLYLFFYYLLSFTWGIIASTIGLVVMLVLAPFGKVKFNRGRFYVVVGKNWGGLELGCFYLICKNSELSRSTHAHEGFGHSLQNCMLGPFFPFVVAIPSAVRYWVFNQRDYVARKRFVWLIASMFAGLTALSVLIPVLSGVMGWFILTTLIFIYGVIIVAWLWYVEVPKWKEKPYPQYDDAWFEGTATGWGLRLMDWYDKMSRGEDD